MSYYAKAALMGAAALFSLTAASRAAPLVVQQVNDADTVVLQGEKSPLLAKATDLGALPNAAWLPHVQLELKRPPALQAALDALVRDQQTPASPSYRRWIAASALRAYGPDEADIARVRDWLQSHGLVVNEVSPSGMSLDFGGTAAAIGSAFHTALHRLTLRNNEPHIANVTDIAIPAALAPVLRGATLSDFFPKPLMIRRTAPVHGPGADGRGNVSRINTGGYEAVGPQDFNTIYNVNPLLAGSTGAGKLTGAGVTVAVIEQTDIQDVDWRVFRRAFGLAGYAGKLGVQHPHCDDPGKTADEGEAALDAEWISVADPDAEVIEASCAGTALTFGVETALRGVVERQSDAAVLSISYGGPEQQSSASFLAGWANLLEEAAAQGKSVFISSGDSGVSYDRNSVAVDGVAVNGLSTNAYNTTIGGTDFLDSYRGTNAQYWRAANAQDFSSARSYIPETPWNNSCAGSLITKYGRYASSIQTCNDPSSPYQFQSGVGGSGGESTVYAKPDFQNVNIPGMPADGMRDQPDLSLFAANGFWGHFLVLCMSDMNEGGAPCDYHEQADVFGNAAGGTSFAAPAFAGIAALIVQKNGAIGNAAPRLYALAQSQYATPGLAQGCISGRPGGPLSACVFNAVTVGDNAEPCEALSGDCHSNAAATLGVGVLRGKDFPQVDAYPAANGYSLATGLGSVNAANLIAAY